MKMNERRGTMKKRDIYDDLAEMLKHIWTLAIVCNQWGDSGKGKIVDLLAFWADIIVRGTGGGNAGHTVWINGIKYVFHLITSGILRDAEGKVNIISNGVALDPGIVLEELGYLRQNHLSYNNLMIALNAKLTLPQHILLDRLGNRPDIKDRIGTTNKGIGPTYVDHYNRTGLIVNDLLNPDIFAKKLERNLEAKITFLKCFDREIIKKIMSDPDLGNGQFYSEKDIIDKRAVIEQYMKYGQELKPLIRDTDSFIAKAMLVKKILLEGAQGLLLSVDKGTYPFVTSSDCSWIGLANGAGVDPRAVDLVWGILKVFYQTRVGPGPFPTEMGGIDSDKWCNSEGANKDSELIKYPNASLNSASELLKGDAIRRIGVEYGATTGRPRRVGWLDLPLVRYAIRHNGPYVILTKLDVLDQCPDIKICTEYVYAGPDFNYGERILRNGTRLRVAIPNTEVLKHCQPVYKHFDGWLCDTTEAETYDDLPSKARKILDFIKEETIPRLISNGADREKIIVCK